MDELEISVVIPVYRNESTLEPLSRQIITHLTERKFEIIYVNDASPDGSNKVLEELKSIHKEIRVINLHDNVGQHKATLRGFGQAKGKKIVVLDADLQDNPDLIVELYEMSKNNQKSIFVKRKGAYQSFGRMMTSRGIKLVIQFLSGLHYQAGSYYIIDGAILPELLKAAEVIKRPYASIMVAHFSDKIEYITSKREKALSASGYSFGQRWKAAIDAIQCSLKCRMIK